MLSTDIDSNRALSAEVIISKTTAALFIYCYNSQMDLKELGLITLFMLLREQSIILQLVAYQAQKIKMRRWWVRPINKRKREQGFMCNLFREITMTDHEEFFAYTRLWPEQYKLLLQLVTPYLRKCSIRKPLSPNARLAITLT